MALQAEKVGAGLSLACAVHCAALPLLAGALGVGHHHPGEGWLEPALIGSAALVGLFTVGSSYRRHGRPLPLGLLIAGIAVLVAGHSASFPVAESVTGLAGALLLLAAQWTNRRSNPPCCAGHSLSG